MEDFSTLYPEEEIADLDDDMLRAALERFALLHHRPGGHDIWRPGEPRGYR